MDPTLKQFEANSPNERRETMPKTKTIEERVTALEVSELKSFGNMSRIADAASDDIADVRQYADRQAYAIAILMGLLSEENASKLFACLEAYDGNMSLSDNMVNLEKRCETLGIGTGPIQPLSAF